MNTPNIRSRLFNLLLRESEKEALRELAALHGSSMSQVVRSALYREFRANGLLPRPQAKETSVEYGV